MTRFEPVQDDSNMDSPHSNTNTPLLVPTQTCLLYTSDAADERSSVDLGGRRIIKKKKKHNRKKTKKKKKHMKKTNITAQQQ